LLVADFTAVIQIPLPKQSLPMQEPATLLISAIRRRLKQVVGAQVREFGLSPSQFWVLNRIFEREGMSLRDLAASLHMDTPTASRVVSALSRQKFVRTEDDPDDRRRTRLVCTARGRVLAEKLHPIAQSTRSSFELPFTPAERETLRSLLVKGLAHVSKL
jgi:MarR family transcriptional regulator, organic hydroperoxide resistance regulator